VIAKLTENEARALQVLFMGFSIWPFPVAVISSLIRQGLVVEVSDTNYQLTDAGRVAASEVKP
jgi:hypothetical protein